MPDSTTTANAGKAMRPFGRDTIETAMRERVRSVLEAIIEEVLDAAVGAHRSARVGDTRQGYRHGPGLAR